MICPCPRSRSDFGSIHFQRLCVCQGMHKRRLYIQWRYIIPRMAHTLHPTIIPVQGMSSTSTGVSDVWSTSHNLTSASSWMHLHSVATTGYEGVQGWAHNTYWVWLLNYISILWCVELWEWGIFGLPGEASWGVLAFYWRHEVSILRRHVTPFIHACLYKVPRKSCAEVWLVQFQRRKYGKQDFLMNILKVV